MSSDARESDITNVDQLRHAIDRGRTADKVDAPDPATVPLGTDAEAGGNPPTRAEIAADVRAMRPRHLTGKRGRNDLGWLYFPAAGVIGLAILIVVAITAF